MEIFRRTPMLCMDDRYTFDSVVKELDAGKTLEELLLKVYPED